MRARVQDSKGCLQPRRLNVEGVVTCGDAGALGLATRLVA